MNRMEEYEALLRQPEELPPALENTVGRARARARRRRLRRRISTPAGSVAAVFAVFVLMVNLWTPFALACAKVPVLKELTAAVAFSPSLKAAVEHDYVQYIGQSQTDNGITVNLEYLIPDRGQLLFFVTVTGPEETTHVMIHPICTDGEGNKLEGYSATSQSIEPGVLSDAFSLTANRPDAVLPQVLHLTCQVSWRSDLREPDAVVEFVFPLETALSSQGEVIEVGQWLELDGNRIYVDSLELYPAHARMPLEEDPDNTETLSGLEFYLTDGLGNRYEDGSASGVVSWGDSYWFESPFFSPSREFTLHITGAEWLEKGREYLPVDLNTGEALADPPEGIGVSARRQEDGTVSVAFYGPQSPGADENHSLFYQICPMYYRAPDGTDVDSMGMSHYDADVLWRGTPDEQLLPEGYFIEEHIFSNYPWNTIEMGLCFTRRTTFDDPVTLALQ